MNTQELKTSNQTKHNVTINDKKQLRFFTFSKYLIATAFFLSLSVYPAFCEESGFTMNFKPTEMFKWAQMVLDMMMPVLYITLGVSLAFIVIRALKSAFR